MSCFNDDEIIDDYIFKYRNEILFECVPKIYKEEFLYYFLSDSIPFNGVYIQDLINAINVSTNKTEETDNLKILLNNYIDGLEVMLNGGERRRLVWSLEKRRSFRNNVLSLWKNNSYKNIKNNELRLRMIIGNCLFTTLTNGIKIIKESKFELLNDVCVKEFDLDLTQFDYRLGHDIDSALKNRLVRMYKMIFFNHYYDLFERVFDYCIENYFK